ncbi:hypothetical protein KO506_04815 [Polaribacter vadi]|uniref:hypothetical protein n=1 Tax=Polaribacter TaxID=52959 RepID=UPI001C082F07|nr:MULTISPECIES: hypothetical protein [Polaribacter]MBU3010710.1 hypothetical protein [Polaribacter vadi]MDO6740521.1 hypothetical protein [Polaribacter sp. 1_MG-2023]
MTNEQICRAIYAVEQSDIKSLFNDLKNNEKEDYKLCFSLKNDSSQLFFCELPNSEYCAEEEIYLCKLQKDEILSEENKSIIIEKIENKFGKCDKSKI